MAPPPPVPPRSRWDRGGSWIQPSATPSSPTAVFQPPLLGPDNPNLIERVKKSFESGKYSDLTIICGNRRWRVHKLQLCFNSDVFEAMLQGHFKESTQQEIVLPDDDQEAVNYMLRYMYEFHYFGPVTEPNVLVVHMRVAKVADKYNLPKLRYDAVKAFNYDVRTSLLVPGFADAVLEAYSNDGYDDFRQTMAQEVCMRFDSMRSDPEKHKFWWDAMEDTPGFAVDVVRLLRVNGPATPNPRGNF